MTFSKQTIAGGSLLVLLAGCAAQPLGPSVAVMPAPNKPFELFQQDQALCKQYADGQVGGQAQAANNQALGGAVLGTVLGAGLGAAVGGGRGAGIGAASGAVVGTGIGASSSSNSQYGIQRRYDLAYSQCMYSRGNQVPGYEPAYSAPPPPPGNYPPPSSGNYPPPPPGNYPPPPPPR
jgi:YmgG-like glycine-zipper protein